MLASCHVEVANRRLLRGDFGVVIFGVESLDASLLPSEWVNRLKLSSEIAEEDVLLSLLTLVDKRSMALIEGSGVPGGRFKLWGVQKSLKL